MEDGVQSPLPHPRSAPDRLSDWLIGFYLGPLAVGNT